MSKWTQEDQELIDWFLKQKPPEKPFGLNYVQTVIDPTKYFDSLLRVINNGPKGPRAIFGTLQQDLRNLRSILD